MKLSKISFTVLSSLAIVAGLFAFSTTPPAVAKPCEYCVMAGTKGAIGVQAMPNKFVTHTATFCDLTVPSGACGWNERMLILKYRPLIRDWVRISDTTKHVIGLSGGITNYHTEDYPVGTGRFHAELDIRNEYGTTLESYSVDAEF